MALNGNTRPVGTIAKRKSRFRRSYGTESEGRGSAILVSSAPKVEVEENVDPTVSCHTLQETKCARSSAG